MDQCWENKGTWVAALGLSTGVQKNCSDAAAYADSSSATASVRRASRAGSQNSETAPTCAEAHLIMAPAIHSY